MAGKVRNRRYARFEQVNPSLRDILALDRTILANERTLLAYLRSGIALMLAGFTFVELFPDGSLAVVGMVAVPAGLIVGLAGIIRWRRMDRSISRIRDKLPPKVDKAVG